MPSVSSQAPHLKNRVASCGTIRTCGDHCLQGVTPERFNRGSTMLTTTLSQVEWVGGPVRISPGFPLFEPLRAVSIVKRLKACGNDGLPIRDQFQTARYGESNPSEIESSIWNRLKNACRTGTTGPIGASGTQIRKG